MAPNTRWLDEDELTLWRVLLASIRKVNRGMDETLQRSSSLGASEFAVLVALSEAESGIRIRELCAELEWDRSRASHQVTRMEKRGLVDKNRTSDDARGVRVHITELGLNMLADAAPEHVESVRRMVFDHMPPEAIAPLTRFFEGVVAVDNIPGYEGFSPDELLTGGEVEVLSLTEGNAGPLGDAIYGKE